MRYFFTSLLVIFVFVGAPAVTAATYTYRYTGQEFSTEGLKPWEIAFLNNAYTGGGPTAGRLSFEIEVDCGDKDVLCSNTTIDNGWTDNYDYNDLRAVNFLDAGGFWPGQTDVYLSFDRHGMIESWGLTGHEAGFLGDYASATSGDSFSWFEFAVDGWEDTRAFYCHHVFGERLYGNSGGGSGRTCENGEVAEYFRGQGGWLSVETGPGSWARYDENGVLSQALLSVPLPASGLLLVFGFAVFGYVGKRAV